MLAVGAGGGEDSLLRLALSRTSAGRPHLPPPFPCLLAPSLIRLDLSGRLFELLLDGLDLVLRELHPGFLQDIRHTQERRGAGNRSLGLDKKMGLASRHISS